MKSITFFVMLFIATASMGQVPHFLTPQEAVIDTIFIGTPPAYGSLLFANDMAIYQWGKSIRNSERGRQAVKDTDASAQNLCSVFSEAFGYTLSESKTPEIFKLILYMKEDVGTYSTQASKSTMRDRPFVLMGESSGVPEQEKELRNTGSFVSGHAAIGVAVSMALACINIKRQNELYKRGVDYGLSRAIVGMHWMSDIQCGQLVGSLTFPSLLNNQAFIEQLNRAKEEFKKITERQQETSFHLRRLPRGVD